MGIFSMGGWRGRAVAALVTAGLGLALLAGCSDDDGGEGATGGGGGSFPVSVAHAHGTTTITEAPERVVTVGVNEQDAVLAMGIVPVGVTEWYGGHPFATWPWAQDELGDGRPEVLNTADGLQFERIAALDPDLIIGTNAGMSAEDYERLSAIAPTIAHGADGPLYFQPWDSDAMMIGRALGKEAEMRALVDDIKDRFAEAAEEHQEFGDATAVFLQNAFYEGRAIAYQDGLSTAFLTDLGFTILPGLDQYRQEDGGQAYIPIERLSVLDGADVLLWATEKPSDKTALEEQPLYNRLEEVREGRLVFTDDVTAGAIYFTSVLSLPHVLDRLVPALASTLAGEGPAIIESPVAGRRVEWRAGPAEGLARDPRNRCGAGLSRRGRSPIRAETAPRRRRPTAPEHAVTPPPHRPLSVLAPPAVRRRARRRAALRDEVWQGPGSSAWRARLDAERRAERRTYALVAALALGLGTGGAIAWGVASGEPVATADRAEPLATRAR